MGQTTKCSVADCGRNKWKVTVNEWERMSTDAKTHDFARGCNSIQNQLVNFSYLDVIQDREVGGSNPLAPTIRINSYGCQHWRPYFICGQPFNRAEQIFLRR